MAKLLILGGGISGQTAALHAKSKLGKNHDITVVTPNSKWNWIPSNIWVGVGVMGPKDVTFDLAPVYKKMGINYVQAKAVSIHPEGDENTSTPYVTVVITSKKDQGKKENLSYDFLINATGPKLKFEATKGLGPDKNTQSVCTFDHAVQASQMLDEAVARMKKGEKQTFLIGTGHGTCTCQGAGFEYLFNVEYELRKRGVRNNAKIIWITNEKELGDFGIGGMHIKRGGYITHSRTFTESLYTERGIGWITQSHVNEIDKNKLQYETLDGNIYEQGFDFTMLLPPFSGVGLQAFDKKGDDITPKLFAPNGFLKVDADYTQKPYEEWKPSDWPSTYQNPDYSNIFAIGIAFAPPHAISKPAKSPNGTPIAPTPPRTGMPSGVMARQVAYNIVDMIKGKADKPTRKASMANMGAACIASAGTGLISGSAVSLTMYPIIQDFERFPETGRDLKYTTGEIGLAGHWIKKLLHYAFIYKAKGNPLWKIVPE